MYKSQKPRSEEEEDGDDDEIVRSKFHILYVGLLMGIGKWEVRIVDPTRWFAIFWVVFSSLGRI